MTSKIIVGRKYLKDSILQILSPTGGGCHVRPTWLSVGDDHRRHHRHPGCDLRGPVRRRGAVRAGTGAGLLAGGAAVVFGGWLTASAVIAEHGWYHTRLGHGVPWMPIAVAGFLGLLLALSRIPGVGRALTAPGMTSR